MDEKPAKTLETARAELIDSLRENKAENAKRLLQKYDFLRSGKDDSGRTAIHWAASGGCLEIVQFCVSQQEDDAIASDDMGWTPLMIACSAGRLEVVRYLISLPLVNVNTPNNNKQTALHYAASKNRPQITSILLKNGANVNAQDNYQATPLHRAASQGHEKIVPILLKEPSLRINLSDSSGCTALHLAVEEQREDIAILLAEHEMAEDTFLGCDLKIWMYIVLSITILAASLEIYRTVKNYNVSDEIIDKILYISIPAVLLGSAILGFIATCSDKKFLLCPLLTVFTILIPLFIASIVLFYIRCMTKPDCKGDTTKIVITTLISACSIIISLCTLSIVCRYYQLSK